MEVEFAYIYNGISGNSKIAESYLRAVYDLLTELGIEEVAFSTKDYSATLITKPIPVFVKVKGDIAAAKVEAKKILRRLGFYTDANIEEAFRIAEKIEKMPIEEVVRMLRK